MRASRRHVLLCWLGCELVMGGAAVVLGGTRVGWAIPLGAVLVAVCLVLAHGPAAESLAAAAAGAAQLAVVALVWADPHLAPTWKAMITIVAAVGVVLCAALVHRAEPHATA